MNTFDGIWLSIYPRPEYIDFGNGGEYRNVFEELELITMDLRKIKALRLIRNLME
jgi:hypothetical protein